MQPISVVIITKNESAIIQQNIRAVRGLTDDILVADTGSTDNTKELAVAEGARVTDIEWQGDGPSKNKAVLMAKYDWVLSIDADEIADEKLLTYLQNLDLTSLPVETIFNARFENYILDRRILHGMWKPFTRVRMFNRTFANWNMNFIHGAIAFEQKAVFKQMKGILKHYSVKNLFIYNQKLYEYAFHIAEKKFKEGKKAGFFKLYLYPGLVFFQMYILNAGFLDGWIGFATSKMYAHYTFLKYHFLKEMNETLQ